MTGKIIDRDYKEKEDNETSIVVPLNANVNSEDINKLNIILNNHSCSEELFEEICSILKEDNIQFQRDDNSNNVNQDNSTIITLDQEYSVGDETIIFAPYNNTRVGNSDSLALAMYSAFDQNGFLLGKIICSKIGYNDDEKIEASVPTDTEKNIDEGCDSSFVTISFGNQNISAKWVAKSIENGLARQKYYLDNYDSHTDLIYRASKDDSIDVVSDYFGTDSTKLKLFNKMENDSFKDSQTIINPDIVNIEVFDRDSLFEISGVKTRAY